jgi:hypothetical protein
MKITYLFSGVLILGFAGAAVDGKEVMQVGKQVYQTREEAEADIKVICVNYIGGGDCWMRPPPVVWDLHFGPYDQSALVREHLPRREPTALQRERREGSMHRTCPVTGFTSALRQIRAAA